ncbi:MAG: flagellar biosynthetic protein FliR, partial [Pseudomonadota bacterium]
MPATFEAFQANPDLTDAFFGLIVKELVIGFLLGVLVWMPSRGVELTGVLLDTQRGGTTAQDYDVIFGA